MKLFPNESAKIYSGFKLEDVENLINKTQTRLQTNVRMFNDHSYITILKFRVGIIELFHDKAFENDIEIGMCNIDTTLTADEVFEIVDLVKEEMKDKNLYEKYSRLIIENLNMNITKIQYYDLEYETKKGRD